MSNKFSLNRIKEISNDPLVFHTKGVFLERLGKIESAIEQYEVSANQEYEKSQYALANIYNESEEYELAEKWYEKSFRNGNIESAFEAGNMNIKILNYENAMYWFEKASKQGHIKSQNNLGVCHFKRGDYFRAEKWLKIANEENLEESFFNLAIFNDIMKNKENAIMFYEQGSSNKDINSKYNLAVESYNDGDLEK